MNQNELNHILDKLRDDAKTRKAKWEASKTRYNYKRYGEAVAILTYWESELKTIQNEQHAE